MNKKELRKKAVTLEPIARIGKSGITEGTLKEIKRQLRQKKLIKIKLLKGAMETKNKKTIANELVEKTESELVQLTGFVVVLYKNLNTAKITQRSKR
ncbi:MAG: YhbY family RNA-binding protein [bacterium]|nr:YhbY family RNA-binding protein [bacterium]